MKKYYFDCGTHMFQGFSEFSNKYNIDSSWDCYCFEPNVLTYKESEETYKLLSENFNIQHLNQAVSNKNEQIKIKCSKVRTYEHGTEFGTFTDQSSNILENPQDWWNGEYEEYDVDAIDFSKFLKNKVKEEDFVLIKLDIEGSEFAVLDKMIKDKTINLVNDLYVEFHERNFEDQEFYFNKKQEYIELFKTKNINFFEWI